MTSRVIWKPEAEQELTRIWLSSPVRSDITAAASLIEQTLQFDPHATGESRDTGVRIVVTALLGVRCYVDDPS